MLVIFVKGLRREYLGLCFGRLVLIWNQRIFAVNNVKKNGESFMCSCSRIPGYPWPLSPLSWPLYRLEYYCKFCNKLHLKSSSRKPTEIEVLERHTFCSKDCKQEYKELYEDRI